MIEQGFEAAKGFGQALLLLDRYFLSVPALERPNACHLASETRMHLVTKAKSTWLPTNVPLQKNETKPTTKKGKSVKLKGIFVTRAADSVSVHGSVLGPALVSGITFRAGGT